ncbi:MAG: hypothetical protein Aurels2KO_34990 [Aureliella sp.]
MTWASTKMKGQFDCPECGQTTDFRLRESRPFLTFYLVPIVPIGSLTVFVQCSQCKEAYEPSVLSVRNYAGGLQEAQTQSFDDDLLTAIALCLGEDQISETQIWAAQRVYRNIVGQNLSRNRLGGACSQTRTSKLSTASFFVTAGERREHDELLRIAQAIFAVASVEGRIAGGRMPSLLKLPQLLGIDEREYRQAVADSAQLL